MTPLAEEQTCLNCCGVTWLIKRTEFGSREASSKNGLTKMPLLAAFEAITSRTLFSSSSFSQESCFLQNWYLVLSRSSVGSAGIFVKGDFSSPCTIGAANDIVVGREVLGLWVVASFCEAWPSDADLAREYSLYIINELDPVDHRKAWGHLHTVCVPQWSRSAELRASCRCQPCSGQ